MTLGALAPPAMAQGTAEHHGGGEANLRLPDLSTVTFAGGLNGHKLLLFGLVICALGLLFGIRSYSQLKNLPVHQSMREMSELIYETCKTYLTQQGKFLIVLWAFISLIVLVYFIPMYVAYYRGHPDTMAIFALNLLLGWTFIGWVVALVWALTVVPRRESSPGSQPSAT